MSSDDNCKVCHFCTKSLSIYPIFNVINEDWHICGRWSCREHILNDKTSRNKTLENLFSKNYFPCGNAESGCKIKLTPSEMEQHEENCNHGCKDKKICKTMFPNVSLYRTVAQTLTSISNHSLDVTNHLNVFTNKKVFAIKKNSRDFYIVTTPQEEKFAVFSTIKYQKNEALFLIRVINLNDDDLRPAQFVSYIIDGDLNKTPLRIYTTNFISLKLDDEWFKYRLEIIKVEDTVSTECKSMKNTVYVNNSLLSSLKCLTCTNLLTSKVSQCLKGHSFCSDCHQRRDLCPVCGFALINQRNLALERVVQFVRFPCKNAQKGCTFVDRMERLKVHQKECNIDFQKCILRDYEKCSWHGTSEHLQMHIEEEHRNHIALSKFISVMIDDHFFDKVHRIGYVLLPGGDQSKPQQVGLLKFLYKNEMFYWGLENINQSQEWMLELDIVNDNGDPQYLLLEKNYKGNSYTFSLKLEAVKFLIKDRLKFCITMVVPQKQRLQ